MLGVVVMEGLKVGGKLMLIVSALISSCNKGVLTIKRQVRMYLVVDRLSWLICSLQFARS